ncbi:polymorphic toxin-type HINT domain-containing protein [Micromonospora sp. NBC_00362]|uniref:polymorphic toxin-type HINT domain-containing protein n=1 Tax=Micromonospora sp. NBC_00362 TaxID=2975975 RepID=UPI002255C5A3|nr:polymorphic toxin-type HINT domain-containing protein [Micromonospora sp. NBC_00362]MCX5121792.1 polymorphic toxin-type HINT domain-containing protein [Micromonospora sp. NBC_00362]
MAVVGVTGAKTAIAAPVGSPPLPKSVKPVPMVPVTSSKQKTPQTLKAAGRPAAVWPAGGEVVLDLAAAKRTASAPRLSGQPAAAAKVGGLPVTVAPMAGGPGAAAASPVRVKVWDRKATERANVEGVVFSVRSEGVASGTGKTLISVDYSAFREAYGGDWAARLRLVSHNGSAEPTAVRNEPRAGRLSAEVPAGTFALTAAAGGGSGDFSATPFSATGAWQVSTSGGGFTYSYPFRVPPVPSAMAPKLAASYSSQATDGRTVSRNNQTSWLGEGWSLDVGSIERSFMSCADNLGGTSNLTVKTGDLCWDTPTENFTMSFGNSSGPLVKVNEDEWRPRVDDGTRINRFYNAANGDAGLVGKAGEYWVVTGTDGTKHYFGQYADSAFNVPVYGNNPGEPCNKTAFADSSCLQTYKWNLDKSVDLRGNVVRYQYEKEQNFYGGNLNTKRQEYNRGGFLKKIEYGLRDGGTAPAPAKVEFTVADRCFTDCSPGGWRDTPLDQECVTTCQREQNAPTFWTKKRLTAITTFQHTGSGQYGDVDRWDFRQEFPAFLHEASVLWLYGITHKGVSGAGENRMPEVEFGPIPLENRVETYGDDLTELYKPRISTITNESGGQTLVTYAAPSCPTPRPAVDDNGSRCFPMRWSPPDLPDAVDDWFHKYVVAEIKEYDSFSGSTPLVTKYTYNGTGAWAYEDNRLVPENRRTWSQWRGYEKVDVVVGDPDVNDRGKPTSKSTYVTHRGMNGDKKKAGGTRSFMVTDTRGTQVVDHEALVGMAREVATYDGTVKIASDVTDYVTKEVVAGNPWRSHRQTENTVVSRTALLSQSPPGERTTSIRTKFDDFGNVVEVFDVAESDKRCTTNWYQPNINNWLVNLPYRQRTLNSDCVAEGVTPPSSSVVSDTRTFYDAADPTKSAIPPVKGNATTAQVVKDYTSNQPNYLTTATTTYDEYGRVKKVTDQLGRVAETEYTENNGLTTATKVTNPAGQATITNLDPAWGVPNKVVEPGSRTTLVQYDAAGRTTAIYRPGQTPPDGKAQQVFRYELRKDGPSYIYTENLTPNATYVGTYELFDGLMRLRQTQSPSPKGGRVLADTLYNSRGLVEKIRTPYWDNTKPPTPDKVLYQPATGASVATTGYAYDGAGRRTLEASLWKDEPAFNETRTFYGGDRVSVVPPKGGVVTTSHINARGQAVKLAQFRDRPVDGTAPSGTADVTEYAYHKNGEPSRVKDHLGNVWRYEYDDRGRQIVAHDPDNGKTVTEYDDANRVKATVDARNHRVEQVHDSLDRVQQVWLDNKTTGTKVVQNDYDATTAYHTASTRFVGSAQYKRSFSDFDAAGRPQQETLTITGDSTFPLTTYTSRTSYAADGTPATMTHPALDALRMPSETVNNTFTDLGSLNTVSTPTSTYVSSTTYSAIGQHERSLLGPKPVGTEIDSRVVRDSFHDEKTGRLTGSAMLRNADGAALHRMSYTYDATGNVLSTTNQAANADLTGTVTDRQCYTYDYLRRMKEAWTTGATACQTAPTAGVVAGVSPYWNSYTYDEIGNRKSVVKRGAGGAGAKTDEYTYPASGENVARPHAVTNVTGAAVTGYSYDAAGNTVTRPDPTGTKAQTLTWDKQGLLTKIANSDNTATEHIYDAEGKLLIRKDPGNRATLFVASSEVTVDTTTKTTVAAARYYPGVGLRTMAANGLKWTATDRNGTAVAVIDSRSHAVTPRRLDPFGNDRGTTGWPAATRGFVDGSTNPATGLTRLGAREYDAKLGKFISTDPIVAAGDPQRLNLYAYANNSPVTMNDASGLLYNCPDGRCNQNTSANTGPQLRAQGKVAPVYNNPASKKSGKSAGPSPSTVSVAKKVKETPIITVIIEAGGQLLLDLIGVQDVLDCANGEGFGSCLNAVLNFTPAKFFKILGKWDEIISTGGKIFKAIGRWRENQKWADDVLASAANAAESCAKHSFAPGTKVVVAGGQLKAIEDVDVGDEVTATDPETGETTTRKVTQTHTNQDNDLTEVTVATVDGEVQIRTTQHHPFWSVTRSEWVDAGMLREGERLRALNGRTTTVRKVHNHRGAKIMYDLTVATVHTYYVMADNTPILVHNNNGCSVPGTADGQKLADQYRSESVNSVFTPSGRLANQAIAESRLIIRGSDLGNQHLRSHLTRDGSDIADWGKYTTRTHHSSYGDFQVHYYYNSKTGSVSYDYDYKAVMNAR